MNDPKTQEIQLWLHKSQEDLAVARLLINQEQGYPSEQSEPTAAEAHAALMLTSEALTLIQQVLSEAVLMEES